MFTPLNQKKLVNVSIVALKKFGRRYELGVYPNKLYEYRNGMATPLNEILLTDTVYRSVSKGEIAGQGDLELFCKPHEEIVREILDNGHEQKSEATRIYEQEKTEREIIEILRNKVTKEGRHLNEASLREAINKVHNIYIGNSKKQSQEVLAKLEKMGFDRVGIKVSVDMNGKVTDFVRKNGEIHDGYVVIRSECFPKFKEMCKEEKVNYLILRREEPEDEEIC
ncbi:putative exosome subunit [Encephalitozoon hellem ATCC 50504]|uniref:Ribosome maturation protein SDO1-like protein n=1 Tax=Encephalitozoon hellem TaxID=27973 RepID=A0A9Q9F8T6_ENCHE|nr:putative exosome subunit [Encephalitozoon hellem ATCC 50504]AFM98858.1 putative exosome subunit [Encephalitozoon hellem ATCC 50504]UTX43838.1 ribosome maturation protein SDO1-like protein [Encephalitozoon hellem]WEL39316.1 Shwachman-Bodian-Diamond syndrome (SBDS) protein [Encephalitozoon hellem]|eukprot:XP_003887839.1 putative exosome subunit [Encephalitozoon hellem ATCC 50504]